MIEPNVKEEEFNRKLEKFEEELEEYKEAPEYEKNMKDVGTQCNMFFEDINTEESIRNKKFEILEFCKNYKKEIKAADLAKLIRDVRPILAMISKEKAK